MASVLKRAAFAASMILLASPAHAQGTSNQVDIGGLKLEALTSQKLMPGRCGLFLWSRTQQPVFIMFANEAPAEVLVRIGGRDRRLARKATSGERVFGHFEKQTFSNGQYTFDVELTYDTSRPIQDGAIIKQGVVRTTDKSGFATVLPVGGMIGCQKTK